jgi:hypothetical protein
MLAYDSIERSKERARLVEVEENNHGEGQGEDVDENPQTKVEMSAYLVEKIIKTYKSHRGATDFDAAYIDAIVNDMKSGKG